MARILIFGVSWFLKLIAYAVLSRMKSTGKVVKALAYYVSMSQKVHMIALNSVAIDLIPYTLITILHTRDLPGEICWASFALFILLVLDYCEIWTIGGKSKISQGQSSARQDASSLQNSKERKNIDMQRDLKENQPEIERIIDDEATLLKLESNMTIVNFCTNDLQEKDQYSKD